MKIGIILKLNEIERDLPSDESIRTLKTSYQDFKIFNSITHAA